MTTEAITVSTGRIPNAQTEPILPGGAYLDPIGDEALQRDEEAIALQLAASGAEIELDQEWDELVAEAESVIKDSRMSAFALYMRQVNRTPLLKADEEVDLAKRIEAGLMATHKIAQSAPFETLPPEQQQLHRDWQRVAADGAKAKEHMIEANLRYPLYLARRKTTDEALLLDLAQEGNRGLVRAVEKFDFTLGYKFSTYAHAWIRRYRDRAWSKLRYSVAVSAADSELLDRARETEGDLIARLGHYPTLSQVAKELDVTPKRLHFLFSIAQPFSLDSSVFTEGRKLGDTIADTTFEIPGKTENDTLDRVGTLAEGQLNTSDFALLLARYWKPGDPTPYRKLAEDFDISIDSIGNMVRRVLAKLAHPASRVDATAGMLAVQAWRRQAHCKEASSDVGVFFPAAGPGGKAKKICQSCPVVKQCLDFALANSISTGVWGGISAAQRDRISADNRAGDIVVT